MCGPRLNFEKNQPEPAIVDTVRATTRVSINITPLLLWVSLVMAPISSYAGGPHYPQSGSLQQPPRIGSVFSPVTHERSNHILAFETKALDEPRAESTSPPAPAISPDLSPKNYWSLAGGAVYWRDLLNVEPNPALPSIAVGRFEPWGGNVELAYHRQIVRRDWFEFRLGMDVGFSFNGNQESFTQRTGIGIRAVQVSALAVNVTPSVKLLIGKPDSWRVFVGAGGGYYFLSLSERGGTSLDDELVSRHRPGGYLSLGLECPPFPFFRSLQVRVENKVHLVDFGSLGSFDLSGGSLSGPINIVQVGLVWGH